MPQSKRDRALILIKPDGVQRGLIGEIIGRFERVGLKLAALKLVFATREQAFEHYKKDDVWFEKVGKRAIEEKKLAGKPIEKTPIEYGQEKQKVLVDFITSGPVAAMIWQGNSVCDIVRKLVGGTEPLTSDVGTIRGDFTVDSYHLADADMRSVRNIIHSSETKEEAEREIKIWFKEEEILKYDLIVEKILYDLDLLK
ncbi:MAG: nucleoside-diphosphate kinase [Patescibacteria group bacterium]|nr:nucleoside-diphosphate kinase [Patescibacteria group bacterium]